MPEPCASRGCVRAATAEQTHNPAPGNRPKHRNKNRFPKVRFQNLSL